MKYQVKLEVFEGPFDLLFHLIEKNEVDIYDIPIAEITGQYLAYIRAIKRLDLELASEFLVMAATLLSIKAKMLLPKPLPDLEVEPKQEEDPRQELVERLLEYKKYKQAAGFLELLEKKQEKIFFRSNELEAFIGLFSDINPLEGFTTSDLVQAFQGLLEQLEKKEVVEEISREEVTVKEKMTEILQVVKCSPGGISFQTLFSRSTGRVEVVVQFLALLELVRLQVVSVWQSVVCGDIIVFARTGGSCDF